MRFLTLLSLVSILFFSCQKDNKSIKPKIGLTLQGIADTSKTVIIEGTEEQPVFTFAEPVLVNGFIFFPDKVSNHVYRYSLDGELINRFGGRGRGPGDLMDPLGISVTSRQTLLVNELGNIRLQEFDLEGNSLTITVLPSFSYSVLPGRDEGNVAWCVFPMKTSSTGSKAIHLVDLRSGSIRNSFGPYEETSVFTHGWVGGMDSNKIYLANILDPKIKVYDKNTGKEIQAVNLRSPGTLFFDTQNGISKQETRESLFEGVKRLREEKYTSIERVFRTKNYLMVVHRRHNFEGKNDFFLDIFDEEGRLHYSAIELPGRLVNLGNGQFAIIQKKEQNLGTIKLNLIKFKI